MKKYEEESDKAQKTDSFMLREFELFDEKSNIIHDVFRVKKENNDSTDSWIVMKNEEIIVELNELSVREARFLKTLEGVQFLLYCAKRGFNSSSTIIKEMKNYIK